jgi:hypothetical protein
MDSIQFEKAEFADNTPTCAACKQNLETEYFQLAGQNICATCAELVRTNQQRPTHADVVRGLLYGAGAAFLGFLGYSIVIWIGFELALVTIGIGYLVGQAVRKGSRGLGGRRCQIAAVALTYMAITFSYIPAGIRDFVKSEEAERAANPTEPASAVGIVVAVIFLTGTALLIPFLGLSEGVGGILTIVIIGFGLHRAWVLTARDPRLLVGPFQREQGVGVG